MLGQMLEQALIQGRRGRQQSKGQICKSAQILDFGPQRLEEDLIHTCTPEIVLTRACFMLYSRELTLVKFMTPVNLNCRPGDPGPQEGYTNLAWSTLWSQPSYLGLPSEANMNVTRFDGLEQLQDL